MYKQTIVPTRQERTRWMIELSNSDFESLLENGSDQQLRLLKNIYIGQNQILDWGTSSALGPHKRGNRVRDLEIVLDRRKANGGGDHGD